MTGLIDSWERQINYLRVSVTDLCNLNCDYCSAASMSRLPRSEILTYEEIERLVRIAASLGVSKVRLTGGEPLLRADLVELLRMVSGIEEIDDISLTTNGVLLGKYADDLKEAGLTRINVSLDTLKGKRFKQIAGRDNLKEVLVGIEMARRAGLEPVKINMVVLRGINDDEIVDFARLTVADGWHIRFIEFMPLISSQAQSFGTVPASEIQERIKGVLGSLNPHAGKAGNGPAKYYRLPGAKGTIGFITPMTEHFCQSCNRLRLTSDGQLRPCLLDDDEVNLKEALRNGANTEELKHLIQQAVALKREQHDLNETLYSSKRPMRLIGG